MTPARAQTVDQSGPQPVERAGLDPADPLATDTHRGADRLEGLAWRSTQSEPPDQDGPGARFEAVVRRTLAEGTAGEGRGFILLPTAATYGRRIPAQTLRNYETIVRLATEFGG